jgi:MFS family permease
MSEKAPKATFSNEPGHPHMPAHASSATRNATLLIAASTLIMLITMGARQSTGLFVLPIISDTGMSIASVSFALAVGQFIWGAAQPVFGIMADRYGTHRIVVLGALVMAAGAALTPFAPTELGLLLTLGVLMAAGAGAGSFSILIGATAKGVQPEKRSFAAGIINAGGSLGQFLFAPLTQLMIATWSWAVGMYALAFAALLTIPLAWLLRDRSPAPVVGAGQVALPPSSALPAQRSLSDQVGIAMRDPSYLCLHAGFFTCGFHVAFLVTHFPGDLQMCGLPASVAANSLALIGLFNVAGSLGAGWLGQRYRMKNLLALIYASRALLVVIYLLMPKTALNVYLFAAGLGVTWLATVPPTAGIIGKLFDVRYLATLFGLTLMSHQIGGFLGAWLGGIAMAQTGSYQWIWYADIALALLAAAANLPIREASPIRRMGAAAAG